MTDRSRTLLKPGAHLICATSIALGAALLAASAAADAFSGRVVGITDGDTITVLRDGQPVRVRLEGIDCPERGQDFGTRARQATSALVYTKEVRVEVRDHDSCISRSSTCRKGRGCACDAAELCP